MIAGVVLLTAGGALAYDVYEDRRQAAAWEELMSGEDCGVCAARKQGIAKKQAAKRAAEAESAASAAESMTQ